MNKTFNDSIFDVKGKDYPKPHKTNWNRIFERAVTALIVFSASYFIIHAVVYLI